MTNQKQNLSEMNNRLLFEREINEYLRELRALTDQDIQREQLSSLECLGEVRKKSLIFERPSKRAFTIPFAEKALPRFNEFVHTLATLNRSSVYIWTPRTNICGLCRVGSIQDINFNFSFGLNREGIVNLLSTDFKDEMVLDFSEVDGDKTLTMELKGGAWPTAAY